jgi:hypothetical protein
MDPAKTRDGLRHNLEALVKKRVIHLEGRCAHYVMVEEVDCSEWGVVITCRPLDLPGIPCDLSQPFMLSAAWQVLCAWQKKIIAYHVSWKLITDEELTFHAVKEAATVGSLYDGLLIAERMTK